MEEQTLPFGKHRGQTLEEVYAADLDYLVWMTGENIVRNGIYWSVEANDVLEKHDEEQDICAKCGNTSCDGGCR